MLVLCLIAGCIQNNSPDDHLPGIIVSPAPTSNSPFTIDRDEAVVIALNDPAVREYIRNGYKIKNVGPLCYEKSLSDGKIYKSCFTGVEFETENVYLTAYVDLENHVVNETATMYIRNPVIAHSDTTSPVPRVSDSERNGT